MKRDYIYFTISLFYDCDFEEIVSVVNQIKKTQIELKKIEVTEGEKDIEKYFNPPRGGAHLPQFCCWESERYPNKIFLISNYEDGLYTLCNAIHERVKKNHIMCSFSKETDSDNPFCQFYYSSPDLVERKIMAYKEERWIFFEEGAPLDIEDENYYNNKLIKKRLNNDIIDEYLRKIGINIWEIDQSIRYSATYIQKSW
jgi:hypothetical protein